MPYEVELKFPLTDTDRILVLLDQFHAERGLPIKQCDRYLAHPQRDFAQTDEALRIRTAGERNVLTYKGPLIDEHTKTRQEFEIPFEDGPDAATLLGEVFNRLGFSDVRPVVKTRVSFQVEWEDRTLEVCLDEVEGLGTYFEIECLADESTLDATRESVLRFAKELSLGPSERKSYLRLLLERDE